ncbi:MAG TPA: alpha/beta hydrolase [Ardenticatenaceae bacterium]|jgi:alpha-beta hydrolase superfamily lysophospholipase
MIHEKGKLTSKDGLRLSYGYWLPDEPTKATVVVVHGVHEHMGRYKHVLEALVARGYAAFALDHRGHGESEGPRGFVPQFDYFVEDLHLLVQEARDAAPRLPLFLVGHSLGSLIAIRYTLRHQEELDGLVVSGVALQVGEHVSPFLKKIGSLLSKFAPHLAMVDAAPAGENPLSRDPEIARLWDSDPLVYRGKTKARIAWEIYLAAQDTARRVSDLHLPLLIMHGSADTMAIPTGAQRMYEQVRSTDKTLKLWDDCRHEIFNELEKGEVIAYMMDWLDERAASKANARQAEGNSVA